MSPSNTSDGWKSAEAEHASRVHAEAVAEHVRACEGLDAAPTVCDVESGRVDSLWDCGCSECRTLRRATEALR